MKIVVIGTRGIPNILGGVETRCQELYPRLVRLGCDVTIIRRSPYFNQKEKITEYEGVKLIDLFAIRSKNMEAILHTFMAVFKAKALKPDILHIHAVGPALLAPLAKLLGMKVVVTHHGPDYDREKWGTIAKLALRMGEKAATQYSDKVIVISNVIRDSLKDKYNYNNAALIFNGVPDISVSKKETGYIQSLGLRPGKYILAMGRFVKEKRFDMLIDAYNQIENNGVRLVLAGDADHPTNYSNNLKKQAKENQVVLTGFISGNPLRELLTHARIFVLPSTHEGLPIALLEAMNFSLNVLASDIPANKAVKTLPEESFFKSGDLNSLKEGLTRKLSQEYGSIQYDLSDYDWDKIAKQVKDVYEDVLKQK
ncbi:MAG: glycosyltransferase family 4 protein [Dysgonamonadaceae bacterium]